MSLGPSNTNFRYENGHSLFSGDERTDNYTLTPLDNGGAVVMNKATAVNVTVPALLPKGFNCLVVQKGAGQVTFVASGTTIQNVSAHTKTSGQWAEVSLFSPDPDVFVLAGSTGA